MRLKLLPVLLLLAITPVPGHGEDLMDSFRLAIANDPVLSTADATRLVVAEGVPQARSALLPQLSASLGLEQLHGGSGTSISAGGNAIQTNSIGHTRERDISTVLSQPIVNFSSIANLRAAHATNDAQEQTYRAALQNLYVRVASAYFNVLIAEDQLDVFKSFEDAFKQEYTQSSERFKNGLVTEADMTQSQAYYLYAKTQRITAQDSLKDSLRGLEQITAKPSGALKKLRDDLPMKAPVPNDAKAWVDAALQTNPTILAAHYTVTADERRISAARAGHLPTISANLQYGKFGNWSSAVPGSSANGPGITTVGLVLTVPIFSGGLTQSRLRQAIYQRDEDQGLLETQRRLAARDANNYFNRVTDGIEQVDSARTAVAAATKSLNSLRAGYTIGTQTLTSVVIAIQTLAQVQSQYTVVRHQFILNKLFLKQAAGSVDVNDLEDINRLLQ